MLDTDQWAPNSGDCAVLRLCSFSEATREAQSGISKYDRQSVSKFDKQGIKYDERNYSLPRVPVLFTKHSGLKES
jgi:hypothetical protein